MLLATFASASDWAKALGPLRAETAVRRALRANKRQAAQQAAQEAAQQLDAA